MANEKKTITKIFCLFHQKAECLCIYPITTNSSLIERLKHHIRLNAIHNQSEPNEAKRQKRDQETILYESRLNDLKG